MPSKTFILDTNVLIENEKSVEILRNGKNNSDINDIVICADVINELDGLKRDNLKRPKVLEVIRHLIEYKDNFRVQGDILGLDMVDNRIIREAQLKKSIVVTNDLMMHLKCALLGVACEEFKESNPFKSESQIYTGFIADGDQFVDNCFYWKNGKLHYNKQGKEKVVDYDNTVWTIKPKTPYQNALMELILDENIDVVSVQSEAGFGKTTVALAGAIELLMRERDEDNVRKYKKIYVFRPNVEIGQELGFLPGDIAEKMDPYFRPITDLLEMLHEKKKIAKIWKKDKDNKETQGLGLNSKKFEMLPINYLRGMTLSDCIVIIDEFQNITRSEARTILSRMGQNVKCIITGDVSQIDNKHCNEVNNALNWTVVKCKGSRNFGHVVLTGKHSRGPIADLVRKTGL